MGRKILVNIGPYESRAAIVQNGQLIELMYEIQDSEKIVGCIYKGRVANIVPGTQAAFVDIGIHKDAYLTLTGVENLDGGQLKDIYRSPIQDMLKIGQDVVLQILKEPTPTKGPRSTMTLSFPGRYLVFMPKVDHIGISRRISQDKERERLRQIGKKILPPGSGIIFRTASEGLEEKVLQADLNLLIKMWNKVEKLTSSAPPRTMLHRDIPLPMKIARDFFNDDVEEMIVDSQEAFDTILEDCEFLSPMQRASLELYKGKAPIFEHYGIEKEIERALSRKIWLNSGGYLYIDKTEAMYCIDVNSGRFSGGTNLEETVFKLNMEAAKEIARQVRLRNLSGMIIIDFIDMESNKHKAKVLRILKDAFRGDRNKPNILDFSELGLVQMTRRRTSASLHEIRKESCPCCHGNGRVLSVQTIANKIRQQLLEESKRYETAKISVTAHKTIVDFFRESQSKRLREIEERSNRKIILRALTDMDVETFNVEPILEKTSKKPAKDRELDESLTEIYPKESKTDDLSENTQQDQQEPSSTDLSAKEDRSKRQDQNRPEYRTPRRSFNKNKGKRPYNPKHNRNAPGKRPSSKPNTRFRKPHKKD